MACENVIFGLAERGIWQIESVTWLVPMTGGKPFNVMLTRRKIPAEPQGLGLRDRQGSMDAQGSRSGIRVSVRHGVVELSDHVESFAEKLEAEHVALQSRALRARRGTDFLPNEKKTSDSELAACAPHLPASIAI
jgi:hypothetical protein